MTAKVIPFKNQKNRITRIVDEALEKHPPDSCPEVMSCLKTELEIIVEKYFIEETPELSLVLPPDLSNEQYSRIRDGLQQLFNGYNDRMLERSSAIFRDLYQSKLEICRLKCRHEPADDH